MPNEQERADWGADSSMGIKRSDERQTPVTWGALLAGVLGILTFSGALLSVFIWIYVELSKQSKDLSDFRVQAAQSYVTSQALQQVELRSQANKAELTAAIKDMSDRFDKGFDRIEQRIRETVHRAPPPSAASR